MQIRSKIKAHNTGIKVNLPRGHDFRFGVFKVANHLIPKRVCRILHVTAGCKSLYQVFMKSKVSGTTTASSILTPSHTLTPIYC
jgi:hypothetical protein